MTLLSIIIYFGKYNTLFRTKNVCVEREISLPLQEENQLLILLIMKKLFFSLIFLSYLLLFSCVVSENEVYNELISDQSSIITEIDTATEVNLEAAKKAATLFNRTQNLHQTRTSSTKIKDILTINNNQGKPSLYIINYAENGGFVLISATRNYMPVLAYSDKGNFDIEIIQNSSANIWFQKQKQILNSIVSLSDSTKNAYRQLWNQYSSSKSKFTYPSTTKANITELEIGRIMEEALQKWSDEGYEIISLSNYLGSSDLPEREEEICNAVHMYGNDNYYGGAIQTSFVLSKYFSSSEDVSPLLKSKWGQSNGYNQFTPNNYPAGCVSVALGQIMRFHQYPKTFDWSSMSYEYPTETTAHFLREIGENVEMDYDNTGSSSNIDKACKALRNKYGYTTARIVSHDITEVYNQIRMGRPVYMRGYDSSGFLGLKHKGHAWVCDGFTSYQTRREITVMCLQNCPTENTPGFVQAYPTFDEGESRRYLSMNWGWNGKHNGYFYDDKVNIPSKDLNFEHGRQNIIDIIP